MNKALLCDREWNVAGNWYAPLKKLESFKSVCWAEYENQSSSAGDWDGFFVQKLGKRWNLIFFNQENNYPDEGFTLYTSGEPFAWFDYCPTKEECFQLIHVAI